MTDHDTRLALIEDRLSLGGKTFEELRSGVRRLAWFGLGLVLTALSVAFAAGQFVSGVDETRKAQRETSSQVDAVKASVSAIEREQTRLRGSIERVEEGQTRIEKAIDRIVSDPLGRRRSR